MIERLIRELEVEDRAMKQAYEREATTLPLYTATAGIATTKNIITRTFSGGGTYSYEDDERVVVTLNTINSKPTLATLEVNSSRPYSPKVRRVPYGGGARWIVSDVANGTSTSWASTSYSFSVHSVIEGVLSVSEVSS